MSHIPPAVDPFPAGHCPPSAEEEREYALLNIAQTPLSSPTTTRPPNIFYVLPIVLAIVQGRLAVAGVVGNGMPVHMYDMLFPMLYVDYPFFLSYDRFNRTLLALAQPSMDATHNRRYTYAEITTWLGHLDWESDPNPYLRGDNPPLVVDWHVPTPNPYPIIYPCYIPTFVGYDRNFPPLPTQTNPRTSNHIDTWNRHLLQLPPCAGYQYNWISYRNSLFTHDPQNFWRGSPLQYEFF